jgi:hypothetical protein
MQNTHWKTGLRTAWSLALLLFAGAAGAAPLSVGGQNLDIPLPFGFVDTATAAPQIKQLGEKQFTSESSRLLVYGVEAAGLERLKKNQGAPIQRYLQVQIPKQLENASATSADFVELKKLVVQQNPALGKPENQLTGLPKGKFGALVEEKSKQVQPGAPLTLGILRDDERCLTNVILSRFETKAGKTGSVQVLTATSHVLLKDKLLHFYLYAEYHKPGDAEWLREASDAWIKAALQAN